MPRTALVALGTLLGLQSLRAFLPLLVYVLRDRFGLPTLALGAVGITVFGASFLFPALSNRMRGHLLPAAALTLALSRGGLQLWGGDPVGSLVLAGIGVLAFPALLAGGMERATAGRIPPAVAALGGALLDAALHAAAGTRDLHWGGTTPTLVSLLLTLVAASVALHAFRTGVPVAGLAARVPAATAGWIAWGPYWLLHVELFGNVARLSSRTGLPTAYSGVAATLGLAVAMLIADRAARAGDGGRVTTAVGLVALVAGILGTEVQGAGAGPLLLLAQVGGALLLARATLTPSSPGAVDRPAGLARSLAFGTGFLLFLIALFAHYAGYDLPLPGTRRSLWFAVGTILAVSTLPAVGKIGSGSGTPRALTGVAVAVALVPLLHGTPRIAPSPLPPDGLRVVSFNLHNGYDERGAFAFDRMMEALRSMEPDVVALQEVSRGWVINGSADLYELAREALGLDGFPAPSVATDWGNAVLARAPLEFAGTTMLPPPDLPLPRAVTEVRMPLASNRSLAVFATHLHHLEHDAGIRIRQSRYLAGRLSPGRDAILLGDFNEEPGAEGMAILREAGWVDVVDPDEVAGNQAPTFPSADPTRRIDTILHRDGLIRERADVAPPWGSDHRAVVAEFSLAPPDGSP